MDYSKKLLVIGFSIFFILSFFGPFYDNYCVNDDCAYSKIVKNFSETLEFNSMRVESPMFSHYFFGSIISFLFGFSHTNLRILGIIFSLALFFALIFLFKKTGFDENLSILLSLLISFNPMVFYLAHSFMADVPALLWIVVSSYFFISWFDSENKKDFFIALSFSCLAIFTRNFAIFVPFAVLLVLIYSFIKNNSLKKQETIILFSFLVLISLFLLMFTLSIESTKESSFGFSLGLTNLSRIYGIPAYLGFSFFGAGIILINLFQKKIISTNLIKSLCIGMFLCLGALIALFLFPLHSIMPYYGNIINSNGFGFISLFGEKAFLFELFWLPLTLFSIISSFVLLFTLFSKTELTKKNLFLIFSVLTYFVLMIFFNYFYDRFILLLIPFIIALIIPKLTSFSLLKPALLFSIIFFMVFGYFGTVDYFLWSNANQNAIDSLKEQVINLNEINAGHSFCSWNEVNCKNSFFITSFSEKKNCVTMNYFEDSFLFLNQKVLTINCKNN
ncbi:MAG: glycosyltransferase family 39 protein [Candidatus Diapherotrites archaeon]|nr:glycosyltransferase family 39 protein [Candidatus Diapherotrites archaeon]